MNTPTVIGTGYLTLDVIIKGDEKIPHNVQAGGSFGNVLTILAYLGANSFPIARLDDNRVSDYILSDLKFWGVHLDLIFKEENGSTPILIHRVLVSRDGSPKHKFEFKNPINGNKFPSFRPFLSGNIDSILSDIPNSDVYYFDRVNRSAITLAREAKKNGSLVFFEPSSNSYSKIFEECLAVADVVKYSNDRLPEYKKKYKSARCALEIETKGAKGLSYRYQNAEWLSLDPILIDHAVDTVGAGDWCSSGIIYKLSEFKSIENIKSRELINALNYGQMLGAINCLFIGARGAMYQLDSTFFSNLDYSKIYTDKEEIDKIYHHKSDFISTESNILELIS